VGSSPTGFTRMRQWPRWMRHGTSNAVTRGFESCLALQIIDAVLAQCRERIGPNDEGVGWSPADGSKVYAREAQWIEHRFPKPKAVGSSPITRSIGRVSSTVERLSYKQATRVRLLHTAPRFPIQG
jgi:hypothetical protein